ncbi:MAG: hypothetical protein Ta2B_30230 [Termitinemataceae bacterium]|nr:MAG: hypothetical protein Ta2B_30230 [Termitinemataceae bacterium]
MKSYEDYIGDFYLGIGWVDVVNHCLIGVRKVHALDQNKWTSDPDPERSIICLHKQWWNRLRDKSVYKNNDHNSIYCKFSYELVPRFRILERKSDGIHVMVGSWVEDWMIDLIKEEFELPDQFKVDVDIHWELGHGLSKDYSS